MNSFVDVSHSKQSRTLLTEREMDYFEELALAWKDDPTDRYLWKETGVFRSIEVIRKRLNGESWKKLEEDGLVGSIHTESIFFKRIRKLVRFSQYSSPLPVDIQIIEIRAEWTKAFLRVNEIKMDLMEAENERNRLRWELDALERLKQTRPG